MFLGRGSREGEWSSVRQARMGTWRVLNIEGTVPWRQVRCRMNILLSYPRQARCRFVVYVKFTVSYVSLN